MTIPKHNVFISFQHGCQENNKPCGVKYYKNYLSPVPLVEFKDCSGYCGLNKTNLFSTISQCSNYSICGHFWKEKFNHNFSFVTKGVMSKSVNDGDIDSKLKVDTIRSKIRDNFISDATVLIVLIGPKTWSRKHVDWEISSGIRKTLNNSRCGLIGIFLPTHPDYGRDKYHASKIPPRLYDNVECGYAKLYDWSDNSTTIQKWIHDAYLRRDRISPDNSYPNFINNKYSANGWK
jgi:hypothetical protein